MESLRQAAILLVNDHVDLKLLRDEVSKYMQLKTNKDDQLVESAITITMDTLHHWSDTTNQPVSLVASCYALEQLKLVSMQRNDDNIVDDGCFFATAQQKDLLILCEFIQSLLQKSFFDRRHFVCGVFNNIPLLPLEMFWMLFKSRVITFQDLNYTSVEISGKFWAWLTGRLGYVCESCLSSCVDVQKEIVQGISVALLELMYQDNECNQNAQAAVDCLKCLMLRSHDFREDSDNNSYNVITALRHSHLTHPQHLRELMIQVMRSHFSTGSMTVIEAFSLQELWKFATLPKNVVDYYSEVCEVLDTSDCGILLSVAVGSDKVAWKNVLEFVSSLINLKAAVVDQLLKDFLKKQFTMSLANCTSHQLQATLLVARQCSSEGNHLFPSYYNWLQDVIVGDSAGNATPLNKKSAQFLVKTFTDLIPHETSSYLQVHAKFLRKNLSKHKMSVDHFMTVAMTQLKDLGVVDKETSDNQGLELGQASSLSDYDVVDQALKLFEQSKEIPSSVMRMSILHPQRFINMFLPILLAPRVQPNVPDTREKFIQKLNQLKKIPTTMISFYESECKRQKDQDLNKSSVPLGDSSEISLTLQRLMDCVKHNLSGSIAPTLSVLSNVITAACHRHGDGDATLYAIDQPEQLDLDSPSLSKWQIELVDVIISSLCSSVMEVYRELGNSDSNPLQRFLWLNNFLEMFSSHVTLHRCWFVRLWELLYIQGGDLLECHVTGLAVLLVHMSTSECAYQQLQVTGPQTVASCGNQQNHHHVKGLAQYGEHLLEYVGRETKEWPCNSLSLLCQMLRHAVVMKLSLPRTTLVKFQYFYSYLSFFNKAESEVVFSSAPAKRPKTAVLDVLQLSSVLLKESEVTNWINTNKLTLKEWLLFELSHCSIGSQQLYSTSKRYAYRCHMLQEYSSCDPNVVSCNSDVVSCDHNMTSRDPTISHDHSELFTTLLTTLVQLYSNTTWANHCWEDGISLLQDQALSLPRWSQSNIILPSAIKVALQNKVSSDAVWCCFRVVSMLPYHLFFSNDPSEVTDMKQSFDVLQNCWAPHLLCERHSLPFDITRFLYKSLQAAIRSFSGSIVSTLLDQCPLLLSSFLVWWPQLKHLACMDNELVQFINSLSYILDEPSATQEPDLVTHDNLPMVVGVCIYHNLMDNKKTSDDFLYKLNILFHSAECRKQTLMIILYCTVYHCGWYKSDDTGNNYTAQLIEALVYTDPELLCPIFEFNDLTSNDASISLLRRFQNYFPINFNLNNATLFMLYFRLVSTFNSSLLMKLLQCREVFQLTLNMYDKYSVYKDTNTDNKWVLGLNDISLITTVFQNIIKLLPDHLLMEVSTGAVLVSEKTKCQCKREMQIRNL